MCRKYNYFLSQISRPYLLYSLPLYKREKLYTCSTKYQPVLKIIPFHTYFCIEIFRLMSLKLNRSFPYVLLCFFHIFPISLSLSLFSRLFFFFFFLVFLRFFCFLFHVIKEWVKLHFWTFIIGIFFFFFFFAYFKSLKILILILFLKIITLFFFIFWMTDLIIKCQQKKS